MKNRHACLLVAALAGCQEVASAAFDFPNLRRAAPAASGSPVVLPAEDAPRTSRKVFATYLPWYQVGPRWDHWKWLDRDPEKTLDDGRRQIAAAHYPSIGPYDSRDDAVLGYHLLLLAAARCDGAFVNWYGRRDAPIDAATRALFDKADAWRAAFGFRFGLALMLDAEPYRGESDAKQVDELALDLEHVQSTFAGRQSYQRLEGKPLLLFFPKPDLADASRQAITGAELAEARRRSGAPSWLAIEHPDPTFKEGAELAYGWISGEGGDGTDFGAEYLGWLYPAFAYQRTQGWELPIGIGIAYPGFDDGGVYAWTEDRTRRRHIDRTIAGKATLDLTWDQADAYERDHPGASWMQVATFNDWNEGSEIEPSRELGISALEAVARRAVAFKGGSAAGLPAAAFAFPARYLEKRRAGTGEREMHEALSRFFAGEHDEALGALD